MKYECVKCHQWFTYTPNTDNPYEQPLVCVECFEKLFRRENPIVLDDDGEPN